MSLDAVKYFGEESPEKQPEEAVLYDGAVVLNGNDVQLSEDITDGGFEKIVIYGQFTYSGRDITGIIELKPSDLLENRLIEVLDRTDAGSSASYALVYIDGALSTGTSLRVVGGGATLFKDAGVYKVIGYRKRYASENNSRTISVNGGNNIDVNSRYEVQLPPEYYESNGSVKDGVKIRVQLYASGANYTGWLDVEIDDWYSTSYNHTGVGVAIRDDGIVEVYTAGIGGTGTNNFLVHLGLTNYWDLPENLLSAPCRVIATLNDKIPVVIESGSHEYERIVNSGTNVLAFANIGDNAYLPLSNNDADNDLFEYNSTTRFFRVKKSGNYAPYVFPFAIDGQGAAFVKFMLVQADTAAGVNPVVITGGFNVKYTEDGGSIQLHLPITLDESKWYSVYAENFANGTVTYTTQTTALSGTGLTNVTDYAFVFTLEKH